jgi:plastocyanin
MRRSVTRRSMLSPFAWAGGLAALALAGCGGGNGASDQPVPSPKPSAASAAVTISIADFKFKPRTITVATGTKVTWTNRDSAPHTATASDHASFDTGTVTKGRSKTLVLAKRGTYSYVCEFHPFMTAIIAVH